MLQRTWTHTQTSSGTPRVIWDMGSYQWEQVNGVLRHWCVVSRSVVSKEPPVIQELLQLLPESPVPLEAVVQTVQHWEIVEKVLPGELKETVEQQRTPETPIHRVPATKQERTGQQQQRGPKVQTVLNQTSRVKPQPYSSPSFVREKSDAASQATQSSQESAEHPSRRIPSELWSSLSQWIPPERFYQPSLHHQATAELSGGDNQRVVTPINSIAQRRYGVSDTPTPTSAHRSCEAKRPYAQQRPVQRPPRGLPPKSGNPPASFTNVNEARGSGRPANFSHQRTVAPQPKGIPQSRPLLV